MLAHMISTTYLFSLLLFLYGFSISAPFKPFLSYFSFFSGIVEDADVGSDLATVRIPATGLPTMKLGKSSTIRPGVLSFSSKSISTYSF
jgi:hypothetical protein